jgi:TIR domain
VQSWIRVTFLGGVNVFVSSDGQSISPGDDWCGKIEEALRDADIALVICAESSLSRPWLGFEASFCLCIQAPNNQTTPGDPNDGSQALGFSIDLPMKQQTADKR